VSPSDGKITPDFGVKEMACPCCGLCNMDPVFMGKLQRLRTLMQRPFKVTSAYRCPQHNKAVGGVNGSEHQAGHAADILVGDGADRMRFVMLAVSVGMRGVGIGNGYVHVDDRAVPRPASMWTYY
jgi:uncharacterized protein YcbK (DUF882 family)